VQLASRTWSALCVIEFWWFLGCTVAEGRAIVEAHEWLAGFHEDNPGVFAFFVFEICESAHSEVFRSKIARKDVLELLLRQR
jgi:hypothetical protein